MRDTARALNALRTARLAIADAMDADSGEATLELECAANAIECALYAAQRAWAQQDEASQLQRWTDEAQDRYAVGKEG